MSDIFSAMERVVAYGDPVLPLYLLDPQFFELSEEVTDAAVDLCQRIGKEAVGVMPESSRLPAPTTILWFPELKDNVLACHPSIGPDSQGEIRVLLLSGYMPILLLGDYTPGSTEAAINSESASHPEHKRLPHKVRAHLVMMAAASMAMINAPRITKRVVAGTRQSRRAAARRIGAATEQWHRVEWDLTKPKVERGERLGKGWHMPLHYTRGHWRRCEEGRGKAVLLPGKGWHTWVDGYWSGHPSYGIKRAVYAPRIGEKDAVRDRHTAFEGCEAAE
jgi:hypothetical protein